MRFLADLGIALRVVAWLREQNHNKDRNFFDLKFFICLFESGVEI